MSNAMVRLIIVSIVIGTGVRAASATETSESSIPSVEQFLTESGHVNVASLRESGREGAVDISGQMLGLDGSEGPRILSPSPLTASTAGWWNGFAPQGVGGGVYALAAYKGDLIAGGHFPTAGSAVASNIARWDSSSWHPLGAGVDGTVSALAVLDGELVAAGFFRHAGDLPVNYIARWDGTAWSALGEGFNHRVRSLRTYGGTLIAGGIFSKSGETVLKGVGRWDGEAWQPLGEGLGSFSYGFYRGSVNALHDHEGQLVAAGAFAESGSTLVSNVARWDGATWHPFGEGVSGTVNALAVYKGLLVAAGENLTATMPRAGVLMWNGSDWVDVGFGITGDWPDGAVLALAVYEGDLYATGGFTKAGGLEAEYLARWDGLAWSPVGGGLHCLSSYCDPGRALLPYDDMLVVGGVFRGAGQSPCAGIAGWTGDSWYAFADPAHSGVGGTVRAIAVHDGYLVAAGDFQGAGPVAARNIARWDGQTWRPLGPGLDGTVYSLRVYEGDLVAAGYFQNAGGVSAERVARWDGANWHALGSGMEYGVISLAVFQGELIAGGYFTRAGAAIANHIAAWNGHRWRRLGTGTVRDAPHGGEVLAMTVHQGHLVVTGDFNRAGGVPAPGIARWDGDEWLSMGSIGAGYIRDFTEMDGELLATGRFDIDDSTHALIGRWDGADWEFFGVGVSYGRDPPWGLGITTYDGSIILGGRFDEIDGHPVAGIAAWRGGEFSALGAGIPGGAGDFTEYHGSLYMSGGPLAGGLPSHNIARWDGGVFVPVLLLSFTARETMEGNLVEWSLAGLPTDFAGFHLYRQVPGQARELIAPELIHGSVNYEYLDREAPQGPVDYWLREMGRAGEERWHGPASLLPPARTRSVILHPPSPSPFASRTQIRYFLPTSGHVTLSIHDIQGRLVALIADRGHSSGTHTVSWDGAGVASGLYFARLVTNQCSRTARVIVLR